MGVAASLTALAATSAAMVGGGVKAKNKNKKQAVYEEDNRKAEEEQERIRQQEEERQRLIWEQEERDRLALEKRYSARSEPREYIFN